MLLVRIAVSFAHLCKNHRSVRRNDHTARPTRARQLSEDSSMREIFSFAVTT